MPCRPRRGPTTSSPSAASARTAGSMTVCSSVPSVPLSPACGFKPSTSTRGRAMRNRRCKIAVHDSNEALELCAVERGGDGAQRQVRRRERDAQRLAGEQHDGLRRARELGQELGVPRERDAGLRDDAFLHGRRHERLRRARDAELGRRASASRARTPRCACRACRARCGRVTRSATPAGGRPRAGRRRARRGMRVSSTRLPSRRARDLEQVRRRRARRGARRTAATRAPARCPGRCRPARRSSRRSGVNAGSRPRYARSSGRGRAPAAGFSGGCRRTPGRAAAAPTARALPRPSPRGSGARIACASPRPSCRATAVPRPR